MLAASSPGYTAEGPQSVIQNLRTTFGLVITIMLTIGNLIFLFLVFLFIFLNFFDFLHLFIKLYTQSIIN
jgi:hypothetical protein